MLKLKEYALIIGKMLLREKQAAIVMNIYNDSFSFKNQIKKQVQYNFIYG